MAATDKFKIAGVREREALKKKLFGWDLPQWQTRAEQYCDYRLDGNSPHGWLRVKQYTNGTVYLEADTSEGLAFLRHYLGLAPLPAVQQSLVSPSLTGAALTPGVAVPPVAKEYAYTIGTDEAGKGDYFGPLVTAGVLISQEQAEHLKALGIRDSKTLTDVIIGKMVDQITAYLPEKQFCISVLLPETYNQTYAAFQQQKKNLNHLLGHQHALVIETLLKETTVPPAETHAVVDQFATEQYLRPSLGPLGKQARVELMQKAESKFIAVATASLLARYTFVQAVKRLADQWQHPLPLGAGAPTLNAARQFYRQFGLEGIAQVAKRHFSLTEQIQRF